MNGKSIQEESDRWTKGILTYHLRGIVTDTNMEERVRDGQNDEMKDLCRREVYINKDHKLKETRVKA